MVKGTRAPVARICRVLLAEVVHMARDWLDLTYPELRHVVADALTDLRVHPPDFPFVNWCEFLSTMARKHVRPPVDAG